MISNDEGTRNDALLGLRSRWAQQMTMGVRYGLTD